jgi:hypothetical protein
LHETAIRRDIQKLGLLNRVVSLKPQTGDVL